MKQSCCDHFFKRSWFLVLWKATCVVRPINRFQMKLFVFSSSNLPYHNMYGSCSHSHTFIGSSCVTQNASIYVTVVYELTMRSLLIGCYKMKFRLYNVLPYYLIRKECPISSILVLPQMFGPIRSIALLYFDDPLVSDPKPHFLLVQPCCSHPIFPNPYGWLLAYSIMLCVFILTCLRKYMNELFKISRSTLATYLGKTKTRSCSLTRDKFWI